MLSDPDPLAESPPTELAPDRVRKPRLAKRVRRWLAKRGIALAALVLPPVYLAYMWLVRVTSRHETRRFDDLIAGSLDRHDRAVGVLWHQEVFSVAYNYRHFHPHTLASVSDFGEIISALLRRCTFVVFRGGAGSKSRRRDVLQDLIDHMLATPQVVYGLTVDGSQGPVYRIKPGCVAIARACRAPIVLVRTHYRRGIMLGSWDRSQIPLPFNRRITLASGPYWIAPDADAAACEAFRAHLEREMLELTARVAEQLTGDRGPYWGFPRDWAARWRHDQIGIPFGPHDLRADDPPPWAHRRR